ncbi:MAG TPA: DUF4097 family beta strand repeat-containing protein [Longimicrobium sp.]|nr:DUF4097 family beta strand repeat-containing protein [Longimicrobium sp.]
MKPTPTRATLVAAALFASATPALAQRDFAWNGQIPAGATLRVYTQNGTVTVRQAGGGEARIRGDVQNADNGEIRFVTAGGRGTDFRVCAVRDGATCTDQGIESRRSGDGWGRNRRGRANFTVEVPRGVLVRVSSGNGDVAVDGATADVHAGSGNGAVRVGSGAARVRASSGNGAVLVDGARGPVNASSGNGRVVVTTANGPVSASTGNGRIEVSMASVRAGDDMAFSSGNGNVTLTLPANFGAELEASTGHGGIESDFPMRVQGRMSARRMAGTIGSGGRRLRISTGNGSIYLRRAGS